MKLEWEPHDYLEAPTLEEMAVMEPETLVECHRAYHEAIKNEREDPLRYGLVLPHWIEAKELLEDPSCDELWIFGGNRSSKSKFASWMVMNALVHNPGSLILCWSQNDEASKLNQQPYFWEYMPKEWRRKQRGQTTKIVYTKAGGFTEKKFILPNGSQCIFKTYSQYLNDPATIEGAEIGAPKHQKLGWLNIGNWFDEYLIGPDLLETMRPRLWTRNCIGLSTWTPIFGYTETVRQMLQGAKTLRNRPAELLNGELVPILQQPKKKNAKLFYFHSDQNPYGGYERTKRELEGEKREHILIRAYGVPTKSATGKFPRFSREHNIVKHDELPFIKDPGYAVTRYLVIDPAPVKPWSMCWIAVDAAGVHYVYRDWPDIGYGEWGEWGKNMRSRPGPASKSSSSTPSGIQDYVDLIKTFEEGEEIFERFIDSRMGNTERQSKEGASTMVDDLGDCDMIVIPAPGLSEDEGLQQVQNLIAWNPEQEIDSLNRTHLIISDMCEQTIMCLQEYTGTEGKNEAWKDFVDVLRYAATSNLDYIDPKAVTTTSTGGY